MTQKRVISIDDVKARGSRLADGVNDEIDAVGAAKLNSPSSSIRTTADGRYRTLMTTPAPGCVDITTGTGVDDSGDEPVSVTDESVSALVQAVGSSTRAALDALYSDDAILGDSDVAGLVGDSGSSTRAALVTLIGETAGAVASDADVAALVTTASTTQTALDTRYALPGELKSGAAPAGTAHSDAGTGAQVVSGGTRLVFRATVTTGTGPVSGGYLATFALSGYTLAPVAFANPRDAVSAAVGPYCTSDGSTLYLAVAGELEPFQSYTYDILVMGV